MVVGGHRFTFKGANEIQGPNYVAARGIIDVQPEGGGASRTMSPEKRLYKVQGMPMTEAAIDTGFLGDRYVSLGDPVTDKGAGGDWAVRIFLKPFVDWIWGGAFLMALGGFVAMSDRRYRLTVKQKLANMVGVPA